MTRSKRGRRTLEESKRVAFATRLYRCILEECGSLEGFKQLLKKSGVRTAESTVRGWLGPLERLKLDPEKGTGYRPIDRRSLTTPDVPQLCEVADILGVSIDWLLTGEGGKAPVYRGQRRKAAALESDVAAYVARALRTRGYTWWPAGKIRGAAILAGAADDAAEEASHWKEYSKIAAARIMSGDSHLTQSIWQIVQYFRNPEEALSSVPFRMLANGAATFEEAAASVEMPIRARTRHLMPPESDDVVRFASPERIAERLQEAADIVASRKGRLIGEDETTEFTVVAAAEARRRERRQLQPK